MKHLLTPLARLRSPHSRWKALARRRRRLIGASFVVALVAGVAGFSYFHSSFAHAYGANAFVMSVKTDNPGTSNATSFTIPITGAGYSYNVDCNDDGINEVSARTTSYTCVYGAAGTYTVAITGTFPRIYFNNAGDRQKLLDIKQWGTGAWTSMANAFYGCNNLQITATDTPNLTVATSLSNMFLNATALTGASANWNWSTGNITTMNGMFQGAPAFNQPIGSWDTSKVTTMASMFLGATAFNQPLDNWNTAALITMTSMFSGATAFNGSVTGWDVSKVTNMSSVFQSASSFNQPLESWNVGAVTNMTSMFNTAIAFNQPLNNWNTSNVTTMREMFRGARAFNSAISNWDTSKVTSMYYMFSGAQSFNQPVGAWNTSSVTSMSRMFEGATPFNQPLNDWDVSNVTDMNTMFGGTSFNQPLDMWNIASLTSLYAIFYQARQFNQPLNSWDVSNIINFGNMFMGARSFNQSLDSWDTSKATTMRQMFLFADDFNQPIGMWDTSSVTDFNAMFYYAPAFNQPIGNWNVSSATRFQEMFQGASSFNQYIGNWNTSAATNMIDMFTTAQSFNNGQPSGESSAPLNWGTSSVTNMNRMFNGASAFNQPISSWNTSNVTNMSEMFSNAWKFNQPLNTWNTSKVTALNSMFFGASDFNQPIDTWDTSTVTTMSSMFSSATSFNQPLNSWNVSAVTNMSSMFQSAHAFNQPLPNWGTGSVTSMRYMFHDARSYNQPLINWNVSAVTDMTGIFNFSAYTPATYDQTLTYLATQTLRPNVSFGASGVTYCNDTARAVLTSSPNNWSIQDGGYCPPSISSPSKLQTFSTNTPTITGTAPPNRSVTIKIDDSAFSTNSQADGSYSFTAPTALADGWHVAVVHALDPQGNPGIPVQASFYIHTGGTIAINGTVDRPTLSWNRPPTAISGITWTQTANGGSSFPARGSFGADELNGKLWVAGGQGISNRLNDVWSSPDGASWTQEVANAPWAARNAHTVTSFNGKLWLMGGQTSGSSSRRNDIWSSSNGTTWVQEVANAPWPARGSHEVVVHDNKLWLIGGVDTSSNDLTDIWSSPDGITWTQVTNSPSWPSRHGFSTASFDGKLWVLGGIVNNWGTFANDIWSSTDGITWVQETANAAWPVRASHQVEVYDNKMWVLGGSSDDWDSEYSDVWFSENGKDWTRTTEAADWQARRGHSSATFANKMWVLGGRVGSSWSTSNDVWSTENPNITYTICWDTVQDGCTHSATTTDLNFTIPDKLTLDTWYFKVQAGGSNLPDTGAYSASPYEVTPPIPTVISLADKPIIHPVTGLASTEQLSRAITGSTLSVASYDCSDVQDSTVHLVEPDGLKVTEANVTLLGGIGFSISCTNNGQSADISLAFGDVVSNDTRKLRAYKGTGATLVDITDQVEFITRDVSGASKTVLNYSLTDGGTLDEDGVANSTIVDPIYIGVVEESHGPLASTGVGMPIIIAFALVAITSGLTVLIRTARTGNPLT